MDLTPSEALAHARKWEQNKRKITCLIVFPEPGMNIAFNGRVSVREGGIVLTGYGGCELSVAHVDTVTFQYSNGYLVMTGVGWLCSLWEPDD
jgi:hypothetical protein